MLNIRGRKVNVFARKCNFSLYTLWLPIYTKTMKFTEFVNHNGTWKTKPSKTHFTQCKGIHTCDVSFSQPLYVSNKTPETVPAFIVRCFMLWLIDFVE